MSRLTYAQPLPARLLPAFFSNVTTSNGCSLCPGALFPTLRLAHDSPIVRLLANYDTLLLPQGHYNSTSDQYLLDNDDRIPRTIRTSTKDYFPSLVQLERFPSKQVPASALRHPSIKSIFTFSKGEISFSGKVSRLEPPSASQTCTCNL